MMKQMIGCMLAVVAPALSIAACSERGSSDIDQSDVRSIHQRYAGVELCNFLLRGQPGQWSSADWLGEGNGTLDLGGGASVTIMNSTGISYDWTATIPIRVVVAMGTPTVGRVYGWDPPAMSGAGLTMPKDPDNGDAQTRMTVQTFCYELPNSSNADAGNGAGDAGTATEDSGQGSDDGNEADGGGSNGEESGGKTW